MTLKSIVTMTLIGVNLLMFSLGAYLVIHDMTHILEGGTDSEASIAHVGKISGSPHLVTLFLGIVLILMAGHSFMKMYFASQGRAVRTSRYFKRLNNSITDSGRTIAELMRRNKNKE